MRKVKTILFSILSIAIVAVFGFEVFASVYISITIGGDVRYYASEIGAKIMGTYSLNEFGQQGLSHYVTFSGNQGSSTDNVFEINGNETDYSNITANIGTTIFSDLQDELEIYVFLKNTGDRYIIPTITVTASETTYIGSTTGSYLFDVSAGNIDPFVTKASAANATALIATVETELGQSGHYSPFGVNSSIDNEDVWCARITLTPQNIVDTDALGISSTFQIRIGFMADVQYTSNDILSVYQEQDSTSASWVKFGYNSTLQPGATKLETNSLSNLYTYLNDADEYGNANITYARDDYLNAVVYRDIDLVNVDIDTGEIIGRLSDSNYDFEWYGRPITIAQGTTIASGRTLETDETFTVDVYTYYPEMYVRRWVVGNSQWMSVSDHTFSGAIRVKSFYTGTFEATVFSPVVDASGNVTNFTAAYNSYGIIPRSYVYDRQPLVGQSSNYSITNYGYGDYSSIKTDTITQLQAMRYATNLTKKWENSSLPSEYRQASGVQGENWDIYVYNMLYIIKYGNNDSQSMVGQGNVKSFTAYNASGVKVRNKSNSSITTGGNEVNSRQESEKGSGCIGVYNPDQKGTAEYINIGTGGDTNYVLSPTGFNAAGMNYGYNSTYTYHNSSYSNSNKSDRQGLFANQFLTYNDGVSRKLLDGYVGSDGYTSVFCLGKCNPWGNIFKWTFGQAVVADSSKNNYSFITFNDYDYKSSTSWYLSPGGTNGYEAQKPIFESRGYFEVGYNLMSSNNYFRYMGTSIVDENCLQMMVVGMPIKGQSSADATTGLTDGYYQQSTAQNVFAVMTGGATDNATEAGIFFFRLLRGIKDGAYVSFGFRPQLISP